MAGFLSTQPYKGTRDFYPEEMRLRNWIFGRLAHVARAYGYGEYGGPLLEPFELYAAKTGEEIVNQQLYSFVDRGERRVAIRPEMTPTLARMVAAKFQELPRPVRLFAIPNFFRYERPQRGRLREFWQLNVDVLGGEADLADAEILAVASDILEAFKGSSFAEIRVNNRGLMDQFFNGKLGLSAEGAAKLGRLIDNRPKIGEEKFEASFAELGLSADKKQIFESLYGLSLSDADRWAAAKNILGADAVAPLERLLATVGDMGVKTKVLFDPSILRGLDYYTGMVFEVFDVSPENRRAMFGGGRYDNLLGLFGKMSLSGVGFGMGDVTLQNFLETHNLVPPLGSDLDAFLVVPSREKLEVASKMARELRAAGLKVMLPLALEGFGAQLKVAAKHGARFAVLLGEDELARGEVAVKNLASGEQKSVRQAELAALLLPS